MIEALLVVAGKPSPRTRARSHTLCLSYCRCLSKQLEKALKMAEDFTTPGVVVEHRSVSKGT